MTAIRCHSEARPWPGEAAAALVDSLPILLGVVPFGLLLGAMAASVGLGPLEAMLMSGLVFAGSAQFLALDLWPEASAAVLVLAVLLVNLRHVLMGPVLLPHLPPSRPLTVHLALFAMVDETWALALRRSRIGLTFAYYGTLALVLWLAWVGSTGTGAAFGALIAEPERYGLDFAIAAVFLCLLAGLPRCPRALWIWAAAAVVAMVTHALMGGVWHILAGALAGMLLGGTVGHGR